MHSSLIRSCIRRYRNAVSKIQLRKAKFLGVVNYFRTRKSHKACLQKLLPTALEFLGYFEVRFAEHVVNVIEVVLYNGDGCTKVRKLITAETVRREKAEANGILRECTNGSSQFRLTASIGDIAKVFKSLEKTFKVMILFSLILLIIAILL